MKSLIAAAVALLGLGGCIAVPAPYYGADTYSYGPPVVGVYAPPVYYSPYWRPRHRHWR